VFLQTRRDGNAAKLFFKRLLTVHGDEPRKIVTDKSGGYRLAHRELIPETIHGKSQYANDRAAVCHQPARARERSMRRFKSMRQARRFPGVHSAVHKLFNLGRHLISTGHYRLFRKRASAPWEYATET
jgi:putative transposase